MRMISVACGLVLVGTALALVAGFLGRLHPLFDSFSHFRVHLVVVALVAALPLLIANWKLGLPVLVAAALAAATTTAAVPVPLVGMKLGAVVPPELDQPVYRLLQANLRYDNPTPEAFLSLVGRAKPDVITLNEVSRPWRDKLRVLEAAYPYSQFCEPARSVGAVAILSRRPFADGDGVRCDRRGAFADAAFDFGGRTVGIAAMHLGWPWPFGQDRQLRQLAPRLAEIGETALLAGDMNATPWSRTVTDVARAGGFDLMPSPGPTWVSLRLPIWLIPFGLPIDQVFAKGDVRVHAVTRAEPVGSDHLPLLVDFSVAPPARPPADEPATDVAAAQRLRVSDETSRSTLPPG
jgi:endonuclease/exonuclease/phosphatase (EEP) superfamily protein YafD